MGRGWSTLRGPCRSHQWAFFSCGFRLTSFSMVQSDSAGCSKLQMTSSYPLVTSVTEMPKIRHANRKHKGLEPAVRRCPTQPKGMVCSSGQASDRAINSLFQRRLTWTNLFRWTWPATRWLHPQPLLPPSFTSGPVSQAHPLSSIS